ncbi:hypothetical protein A4A49_40751 [Nicotiana attenuata]|uniref:Uncharacterized protein n=1 Tax=Nicotiana attenuata TaxID=49451 RepID=A0A1J6JPP3_NICAT|nr:hypothetical protein A4A49_40751 [Nicotiana attenuata]
MSSRASSPVLSEKNDQFDRTLKESAKAESWQSNDFKNVLTGSEDGDGSPATGQEEERSKIVDEGRKSAEARAACTSGIELKSGKLHEASFSSINALIESCVKYSEANVPINTHAAKDACTSDDVKSKSPLADISTGDRRNDVDGDREKLVVSASASWLENKLHPSMGAATKFSGDRKASVLPLDQETMIGGYKKQFNFPCIDSQSAGVKLEITKK